MRKEHVTILVVFVFCCGIGLGLFLGIGSQKAKVVKLGKDNRQLTTDLVEAEFYVTILDLKVQAMLNIWSKMIAEEDKIIYYNDEALGN